MKKINFLIALIILVSYNGCKNNEQSKNDIKKTKNEDIVTKSGKDDKVLNKIGISTENDKIIIEPKKTKAFFDKLAKTLEKNAKNLEQKTKTIDENDIGISTSKDKITIDLNKTKSFLDSFSKELEKVAKDIQDVIDK